MAATTTFALPGKFYVEIFQNFARTDVSAATLDVSLLASTPSWVADFRTRVDRGPCDRSQMIEKERVSKSPSADGGRTLTFRKLRCEREADPQSIRLSLFRAPSGRICGWFIGPLIYAGGSISMPHLAPSKETLASIAVIRAAEAAESIGVDMCLIDPDDLWAPIWRP